MAVCINNVIPKLPPSLEGLINLALDLRFSWSHSADKLWLRLDKKLWQLTHNPWLVLQSVSQEKLEEIAADKTFCKVIDNLLQQENEAMEQPRWYQQQVKNTPLKTVAYFSMEFGLSESLPIYSGGLGLLAGDHLKAVHDLGVPLVGIGILYQNGYFRQCLNGEGTQIALYPSNNIGELPVTPVRDQKGNWLRLELKIPGHSLQVRLWQARIGLITLYLLDTNDPTNSPVDRCITTELYGGGSEQRLQQEILLGIGGWRALKAMGIHPEVCHLNEGHAAFAVLERARDFMVQNNTDFATALTATRVGNLFTTHTPVAAGFDHFEPELMRHYMSIYAAALSLTMDEFLALGRIDARNHQEPFNMAYLAVRGSGAVNGVSLLHGEVSRRIFSPLFPGWPVSEIPVGHVTNGVHVPTWDSADSDTLWTEICGKQRWLGNMEGLADTFRQVSNEAVWELRMKNRQSLVDYVQRYCARQLAKRGSELNETDEKTYLPFDPNVLTLGFARRFATYKRPNLLLHDPERLIRILTNPDRPMQLVIAGKAHPADHAGQHMIKVWWQFMQRPEVRGHAIFIADYDILVAERLVEGVDLWLNNPERPWEASGTSGMKVLVNGGLNLSELDGWWAEAYSPDVGWALGDGKEHNGDSAWNAEEANQLYDILENQVIPEFYTRDENGLPLDWVSKIRESMARLTPFFSTNRMVREYVEKYYLPLAENYSARIDQDNSAASELTSWQHNIDYFWSSIHFGEANITSTEEHHNYSIPVYLGDLTPQQIRVELFAEALNGSEPVCLLMNQDHELCGTSNGFVYSAQAPNSRPPDDYTVRIIPDHPGALVPLESCHILWHR